MEMMFEILLTKRIIINATTTRMTKVPPIVLIS